MSAIHEFENDQLVRYADNLIVAYKEKFTPQKNPKAYLLGGQSGAGKTTLQGFFYKKQDGNIIFLNGDNFRKGHPSYMELKAMYGKDAVSYTGDFSGKVTEYLIDRLSDEGYPLLIEGTLRTVSAPEKTACLLKGKGYETELSVIGTKPALSYLSTILRYELQLDVGMSARITSKKDHDLIVAKLIENLYLLREAAIFDNITIFDREERCLYSGRTDTGKPEHVLKDKLFGSWSREELEMLSNQAQQIGRLMRKRGAPELPLFLQEWERIQRQIGELIR